MLTIVLALACTGSDADPPSGEGTGAFTEDSGSTGDPTDAETTVCREGELQHVAAVGSYEQQPLFDGQTVVLTQGPQGGYHVDMNGVVSPVPDVGVVVAAELRLDDGTQVAFTDGAQVAFEDWADCEGAYVQARMFWNSSLDAATLCSFVGREATMDQTLEDLATGRMVSGSYAVSFDVALFHGTCADLL